MLHPADRYYPTDLDTDPREMALADHWQHRDAALAMIAEQQLADELLSTEEFVAWSIARTAEAIEHQAAAYDAAQVAA
jgi:hypothetical protein